MLAFKKRYYAIPRLQELANYPYVLYLKNSPNFYDGKVYQFGFQNVFQFNNCFKNNDNILMVKAKNGFYYFLSNNDNEEYLIALNARLCLYTLIE